MSAPHTFQSGSRLGRFRLDRVLGRGAYGVVWLAVDEGGFGFRRRVALKILSETANGKRQQALLREARICGALNHPGLVAVSGVGRFGEFPYIVMEYVEGETLSSLWKDLNVVGVRFPRSVILEIGISVADALHHAWTVKDEDGRPLRLVHRDLKPANILLSDRGVAKVGDFGIAKVAPDPSETRVGRLKGTPSYMAPELWMGTRDFRPGIDLWSLGVVLWELASGRRFFGDAKMAGIPELIRARTPEQEAEEVADYFPALVPVLRRALSRRIDERPATGLELAGELRRARAEVGVSGDLVQFMRVVRAGRLAPADRDGSLDILPSMPYVADDWLPLLGLAEVEADEITGDRARLDDLQDFRPLRFSLTQAQVAAGRDVEAPTLFDIPAPGGLRLDEDSTRVLSEEPDPWSLARAQDGGLRASFALEEDSRPPFAPRSNETPPRGLPVQDPLAGLPDLEHSSGRLRVPTFGMSSGMAPPASAPGDPRSHRSGRSRRVHFTDSDSMPELDRGIGEVSQPVGVFRAADIAGFDTPADYLRIPAPTPALDVDGDAPALLSAMETGKLPRMDEEPLSLVDSSFMAMQSGVRKGGGLWLGLTMIFLLLAAASWFAAGVFA